MKTRMWMIAYPRQGKWFHIQNLLEAGEVYKYALDHLISHDMVVNTICGDQFRRIELKTQQRIEAFYWYLKNNINTDDLKLRLKVREK